MVVRIPAKKNARYRKSPRNFPPKNDDILLPAVWLPWSFPQSGPPSKDGQTDVGTLNSKPKFLAPKGYQICLPIALRSAAFGRIGAPLLLVLLACLRISE